MNVSSRQRLKTIIVYGFIFSFLLYIAWFFYSNPERLTQLFTLSASQLAILSLPAVLVYLALGTQLLAMLHPYETRLSLYESVQLTTSSILLNYFPMKAGVFANGAYLKSVHKLAIRDYIVALTAGQLLWILVAALLGLFAALLLISLRSANVSLMIITGLLLLTSGLAALLFCYVDKVYQYIPLRSFRNYLQRYAQSLNDWKMKKNSIRNYSAICSLVFLLLAARIWISFLVVDQALSFLDAVFLQACLAVGFAFSLVPGNLGLREGAFVGLAVILQLDAELALLAALIDRAASILPALLLGPYFLHRLSRKILLH